MERLKNLRRQGVVGVIPCDPPIRYALTAFAERDSEMELTPDQADAARAVVDGVNLTVVGEPDPVSQAVAPPKSPDKPKSKSSAPETVEAPQAPPSGPAAPPSEG